MSSFETRWIDSPRGRLAYFDEGRGAPIVMVHGLGGDFTHFEPVARALSNRFRVIGVDLPGCGASEKPRERCTLELHARALLGLLDGLALPRATLVGHSAGGQVCARAAVLAPHAVDRLILINSAGLRSYPAWARLGVRLVVRPWLVELLLARNARRILDAVFHEKNANTHRFTADRLGRPAPPNALKHISKVFHDLAPDLLRPTVVSDARRITMPTLIIWGDRDRLVPLPTVRQATALLPRGSLEIIEQCGHMPIVERPSATTELIERFLAVPEVHAMS